MQSRKFVPPGNFRPPVFAPPRHPRQAARILAAALAGFALANPASAAPRDLTPAPFDPLAYGSALDHLADLAECASDPAPPAQALRCIRAHLDRLTPEERRALAGMAAFGLFFAPPPTGSEDDDAGDVAPFMGR